MLDERNMVIRTAGDLADLERREHEVSTTPGHYSRQADAIEARERVSVAADQAHRAREARAALAMVAAPSGETLERMQAL